VRASRVEAAGAEAAVWAAGAEAAAGADDCANAGLNAPSEARDAANATRVLFIRCTFDR
jgi:hypothetical protein